MTPSRYGGQSAVSSADRRVFGWIDWLILGRVGIVQSADDTPAGSF
jgi:hypothetical protein